MAGRPETYGMMTEDEIDALDSDDIVLIEKKSQPGMWHVGDVNTLQESDLWNPVKYNVYNLRTVQVASLPAHKRWVRETWYN